MKKIVMLTYAFFVFTPFINALAQNQIAEGISVSNTLVSPGNNKENSSQTNNDPITRPLKAFSANPNYFTDGTGKAVYLTGSHTWNTFQDWGTNDSIRPVDFSAFVKMLVDHHHG